MTVAATLAIEAGSVATLCAVGVVNKEDGYVAISLHPTSSDDANVNEIGSDENAEQTGDETAETEATTEPTEGTAEETTEKSEETKKTMKKTTKQTTKKANTVEQDDSENVASVTVTAARTQSTTTTRATTTTTRATTTTAANSQDNDGSWVDGWY